MTYEQLTQEQIDAIVRTRLRNQLGEDINLSERSVPSTLSDVFASVGADVYEPIVQDVYESAFLESATGSDLDNVVELLGLSRRSGVNASGVVTFQRSTPVTTTYTIQSGTLVQTDENTPVRFETTEAVQLQAYDLFETTGLSNYAGDTGYFGVTNTQVSQGNLSLEGPSSGDRHIYRTDKDFEKGMKASVRLYASATSINGVTFGVRDPSSYYRLLYNSGTPELVLEKVDGGTGTVLDTVGTSDTSGSFTEIVFEMSLPDSNDEVTITCSHDGNELSYTEALGDEFEGGVGMYCDDGKAHWDWFGQYDVSANVTAVTDGTDGNVAANSLEVLPVVPGGVETVTNVHPTGETVYEDLSNNAYVEGLPPESDEELRTRARNSLGEAGTSTIDAIQTEIASVNGVKSVTINENATFSTVNGIDPVSIEPIVYGGNEDEIAQAIFDKKAGTANVVGGANGTADSGVATSQVTGENFTIDFSRPTEQTVTMTIDVVVDDEYIGDDPSKDLIINHVGGTTTDGSNAVGLEAGEDVIVDKIRDLLVGDDTGIIGVSSFTSTPSTTTDGNGLTVVPISSNEVATTDGSSITLNVTQV